MAMGKGDWSPSIVGGYSSMAQTPTQSNAIEEGTRWNLYLEDLPGVIPLGQTPAERDQV